MSRSFRPRESILLLPGLLLTMVGTTLMLIGFFLPLVFWQGRGSASIDGQESQWEMVVVYSYHFTNVWLLWATLVLPFLAALIGLVMSIMQAIVHQYNPLLARWKRYIAGPGAILELLVGPFVFFISGIEGAKIFLGPGLVLLMLGSLVLLVGLRLERRR